MKRLNTRFHFIQDIATELLNGAARLAVSLAKGLQVALHVRAVVDTTADAAAAGDSSALATPTDAVTDTADRDVQQVGAVRCCNVANEEQIATAVWQHKFIQQQQSFTQQFAGRQAAQAVAAGCPP